MWIVIECHGGPEYACICKNNEDPDNSDDGNAIFTTEKEAKKYADEECQEGLAIQII